MINQISVFLENRSGQLLEITSILKDANINMRAISIAETNEYGIIRLITDQPEYTVEVLKKEGFVAAMSEVLVVPVLDKVGGLNAMLKVMADENVNIQYMYSIFEKNNDETYMAINVDDPEKVTEVLEKHDMKPVMPSEIGIK